MIDLPMNGGNMIEFVDENLDRARFNAQAELDQLGKSFSEINESVVQIVAPLRDLMPPVISPEVVALLDGPIVPPEMLTRLMESIVSPDVRARFQEMTAAWAEEHRLEKAIIGLGIVPHAALFEHFALLTQTVVERTAKRSEAFVNEIWPNIRSKLELALDGCLDDRRLFQTYSDMLGAHEAGLHQLMAPSAVFVIERAAQLAQRQGSSQKTAEWVNMLGELPLTALPNGWRAWVVLDENTFRPCWADGDADAIPYVNRHAAAHGRGTKLLNVVDSFNAVLLAHFAITAAAAFDAYSTLNRR
jgi:hypothetical protein